MKKVLILIISLTLLSGCGKKTDEKIIKEFKSDVNSSKSYQIKGELEIYNDEDTYSYNIEVKYKKDNKYKVNLINKLNNHEQVILKNDEGTYVITPSLNKSYKFQSEWPNNSSQSYILESIINDLNSTDNKQVEETEDYYIINSNVNYPNNSSLKYQKLYLDKEMNLKLVEVYNNDNQIKIKFMINSLDYKAKIEDNEFTLDQSIDKECCQGNESTPTFNDILYPLYIPVDTYLTSKETLNTDNGSRAILTFSGSKDFVLVEEAAKANEELEIIPIHGDPLMMNGSIGALSGNSLYWSNNNVEYYLAGNELSQEELLSVANSISNTIVTEK